jgi:PAS domain S-box-containing protein
VLDDCAHQALGEPGASLLAAAIDVSAVSVTIADLTQPDAPLVFANSAFLETTGYRREEIIGRNCRFLQGPQTDPKAVAAMQAAISAGESCEVDLLNYRKSGEPFWNNLHLSPVFGSDGGLRAYIGVQHDVTGQRAAREAQAHRQRIEALGRMAAGLAHELNNMLQPLITLPDLIAASLPEDAAEAREDLDILLENARAARDLVSDMLAYSRTGYAVGAQIDAASALRKALPLIERTLNGAVTVRMEIDAPADLRIANWTQSHLQQVLVNLVLNAAQAMQGRGEIRVRLGTDREGGAQLCVSDQGCGMDETVKARLFEPFFTTKPIGEGVGLGLHIVHDLVRQAGGRIEVESAEGEGATFILRFPPTASDTSGESHGSNFSD